MIFKCPHCGKETNLSRAKKAMTFSADDLLRFWKRVAIDPDGCWLFTGNQSEKYGRIKMGGQNLLPHVASYIIHYGAVPEGHQICHSCDVPRCVRPEHLSANTQSFNMRDMVSKNRHKPRLGLQNNLGKLSDEAVVDIRTHLQNGTKTIKELSVQYDVSFQAVYRIGRSQSRSGFGGPVIFKKNA